MELLKTGLVGEYTHTTGVTDWLVMVYLRMFAIWVIGMTYPETADKILFIKHANYFLFDMQLEAHYC